MMLRCVFLVILSIGVNTVTPKVFESNAIQDDFVINRVVDQLLKYAREAIRDDGLDRIPVPDLEETFDGPVGTKGQFLATNGSVAYLSSVRRTGDARMVSGRTQVSLILYLGLEELVVDFNHYLAKYMDIGPTGKMRATIGNNSVYVDISLTYNLRQCTEQLVSLFINELDDIQVKLTGLDPFNWLLDDIASWVATDLHDNIRYTVEDALKNAVKNALAKYNICKFLPHPPHFPFRQ